MENMMNMPEMTAEPTPMTTEQVLARIIQIKATLDNNKPLYEELDQLVLSLKGRIGTDKEVIFGGKALTVVDNFSEKNTVFRPCGVKRFDLDMEDLAEREAKVAKKAAKKSK